MNLSLKRFLLPCMVLAGLFLLTGCAKSIEGTYKPVETEKPGLIDRLLVERPILKFEAKYVQVSRSGAATVREYEYRVEDGVVEIVMPNDGEREIWRLVIQEDGSLSNEGKLWKKIE